MRKLLSLVVVTGLAVAVGCSPSTGSKSAPKSGPASGPAPVKSEKASEKAPEAKGSVKLEGSSVDLVTDKKDQEVMIKIDRVDFKDPVTITFDAGDTKGITGEPLTLKEDEKEGKIKLNTAKDAKGGTAKLVATGKGIKDVSAELKITVKEK